jgi:hypothetical protein
MPAISIQPANPVAISPEELQPFASEVASLVPTGIDVHLLEGKQMAPGARAVTWWEVVRVSLSEIPDDVRGGVVAIILDRFLTWAKKRFGRKHEEGPDRRPKCIVINTTDNAETITRVLRNPRGRLVTEEVATRPSKPRKRARRRTGPAKRKRKKR